MYEWWIYDQHSPHWLIKNIKQLAIWYKKKGTNTVDSWWNESSLISFPYISLTCDTINDYFGHPHLQVLAANHSSLITSFHTYELFILIDMWNFLEGNKENIG